jgi:hypothetical protein
VPWRRLVIEVLYLVLEVYMLTMQARSEFPISTSLEIHTILFPARLDVQTGLSGVSFTRWNRADSAAPARLRTSVLGSYHPCLC